MDILRKKLGSNKAPYHYLTYCLSFITYGGIITGIGPLVPYLSAITGHVET